MSKYRFRGALCTLCVCEIRTDSIRGQGFRPTHCAILNHAIGIRKCDEANCKQSIIHGELWIMEPGSIKNVCFPSSLTDTRVYCSYHPHTGSKYCLCVDCKRLEDSLHVCVGLDYALHSRVVHTASHDGTICALSSHLFGMALSSPGAVSQQMTRLGNFRLS